MNRVVNSIMISVLSCSLALTVYSVINRKDKDMLDILIEEIEIIK